MRPDLAIFSVGFLVVLLSSPTADGWRPRLRIVALAVAVPLAYELFRMGYYAALVPNTALAKEASAADWSRGWHYLTDLVDPYYLVIPLVLLLAVAVYELRGSLAQRRTTLALVLCPVVCGLVLVASILWIREVPLRRGFEDVTVGDEASPQPGTRVAAR